MERPSGPPMGAATQSSTGRPILDSSGAPVRNGLPNGPRRTNPVRSESVMSNSSASTQAPMSSAQVIALAREAMSSALEENRGKTAEASGVSNELKPGVTIDLSHMGISKFPDEVVDIIKSELERLALSHNQITTFPRRFAECSSLRYLNVRSNLIREFPSSICELTSLEILDLGRNKLSMLPPELAKLTSLKVLSVQKNRIENLPLCLADMTSLQCLKLEGNPLRFPPRDVLEPKLSSPPNGSSVNSSEGNDMIVTAQIKKFLKAKAIQDRSETESGGEESSEGTETPRPLKRVMSGRFPIKVNGTDVLDMRSPAYPRPPIPPRSHYRGLSHQSAAPRRSVVLPLTIGTNNERLRSNSENLAQASRERGDRLDKSRRLGIMTRKPAELSSADEAQDKRYSHYRGLSHGSALQIGSQGSNGTNARGPVSPADGNTQRATYVRRLSSLPERKRESSSPDPITEGAKGILYALFQVHPNIQSLVGLAKDPANKRASLERVFYNAITHVEELDRVIQNYDAYSEEDDEEHGPRSNESVYRACVTCVQVYIHVCSLLVENIETLVTNCDPRYIRTLILNIYGSLAEVRNAGASLFAANQANGSGLPTVTETSDLSGTIKPHSRGKSNASVRERPPVSLRSRSATVVHQPAQLRVTTDARSPNLNGASRSATMTSATPRSGESFLSSSSTSRSLIDFSEEDRIFERIFLSLQKSSDMVLHALPTVHQHLTRAMRTSLQQGCHEQLKRQWQGTIAQCLFTIQQAEYLKARLSQIKLKEPGLRLQNAFWNLCSTFITAYYRLVIKVKEIKAVTTLLPNEVIVQLRPLQKATRETGALIIESPWSNIGKDTVSNPMALTPSYMVHSPQMLLPMTPASAALGPAVQATVPSAPPSASYSTTMFNGNVFERADTLLSMSNGNMNSRAGTMISTLGSGDSLPPSLLSPSYVSNNRYSGR